MPLDVDTHRRFLGELGDEYRLAKAREAELESQLAAARKGAALARDAASSLAVVLGMETGVPPESLMPPGVPFSGPRPAAPTRAALAERVLRAAGRPLSTAEVVSGLATLGQVSAGGELKIYHIIYAIMRRHPGVFKKVRRGLWGLREWDRRPAPANPPRPAAGPKP